MTDWYFDHIGWMFWMWLTLATLGVTVAVLLNTVWLTPANVLFGAMMGNAGVLWWAQR